MNTKPVSVLAREAVETALATLSGLSKDFIKQGFESDHEGQLACNRIAAQYAARAHLTRTALYALIEADKVGA